MSLRRIVSSDFNPLPSCEGRPASGQARNGNFHISIHSPHARGDSDIGKVGKRSGNFNPLPSCEGRLQGTQYFDYAFEFQSTPLMRGETRVSLWAGLLSDFNPLPSCEGRL